MPKFIIRFPSGGETSFSTEEGDIFIGRIPSINDICLNDPSVSRQHAHIKKREEGYTIYDLKSLNGIYVNDKKVRKGLLRDGDEIQLGDIAITVRLQLESPEAMLQSIEQSEATEAEIEENARVEATHPGLTQVRVKKPKKKKTD